MPHRILRDCTDSEKVNSLSVYAEVFFYRLIMKADDFGSYHANPQLLRSILFPLRPTVRTSDISLWLAECQRNGLIVLYAHAGKPYLRIVNYGQRLRNYRNKFPEPPPDVLPRVAASCRELPPEEEVEDEIEEEERENARARDEILKKFLKKFSQFFPLDSEKLKRERDEIIKWKEALKNDFKNDPEKLQTLKEHFEKKIDMLKWKKGKIVRDALDRFWDYYAARGWKAGGNVQIVDREAQFRNWLKRENQF